MLTAGAGARFGHRHRRCAGRSARQSFRVMRRRLPVPCRLSSCSTPCAEALPIMADVTPRPKRSRRRSRGTVLRPQRLRTLLNIHDDPDSVAAQAFARQTSTVHPIARLRRRSALQDSIDALTDKYREVSTRPSIGPTTHADCHRRHEADPLIALLETHFGKSHAAARSHRHAPVHQRKGAYAS